MSLQKLALPLTLSILCFGCQSRSLGMRLSYGHSSLGQSEPIAAPVSVPILTTSLKAAIEEVRVMRIKIERDDGIHPKEYKEDLIDLDNIVDQAYGDPKTLASVKSLADGHKLTLKFVQCDRAGGYNEMLQCRDNVLKKLFVKYPEFAAAAQDAVEGEELSYISAGLDRDAVLQAIWLEIAKDTDKLLVAVNMEPTLAANPSQQ